MKKVILSASLVLLTTSVLKAQWSTSGTNIFNSNTGNVGINTSTPATKLHLDNGAFTISGNNPYGGPMMLIGPAPSNNNTWGMESTPNGLNFWRPWNGQVNAGNYFLYLKHTNGNVGIKTDNPTAGLTVNSNVLIGNPTTVSLPNGYKLYVETGILTEKVKVAIKGTANWSDFVFANDYKLMPLKDVETFILNNKHLPGIPSAEAVVKEGIDLGEMDAKLLQKIEELTLHIIQLEKEINILKQK
jgi:hypothetical protein